MSVIEIVEKRSLVGPRRLRFLAAAGRLVVFLACSVGAYGGSAIGEATPAGATQDPSIASGASIHFKETEWDFGMVKPEKELSHVFEVENRGTEPLQIAEVVTSCGCTTAGEWSRVIEAGKTGKIPVSVDPRRFRGGIVKTVTVKSNDAKTPSAILTIRGSVWVPIQITPSTIVFPAMSDPDAVMTRTARVLNQTERDVEISNLKVDSESFKVELKPVVEGKEFELVVTTVPPLKEGNNRAAITMNTSNPSMLQLVTSAVAVVLPAVQLVPPEITLPAPILDAPVRRYVTLLNRRGADLEVSDVKAMLEGVEVARQRHTSAKQISFSVTFPKGFQVPETKKAVLSGKTNRRELPEFEILVGMPGK